MQRGIAKVWLVAIVAGAVLALGGFALLIREELWRRVAGILLMLTSVALSVTAIYFEARPWQP